MKDERIVDLFFERSEEALRQAEAKYKRIMLAQAGNVLYDREDCLEAVNDALLAAWDSIPPNRPDSLGGYLIHLVRQISIDRYRKLCSVKRGGGEMTLSLSELEEVISHESGPESELENSLLNKAVADFFGSLSPEERRLFIARYYYFDPVSRAAHYCGMSVPKAKSMLFRLRRRLREHLEKEGIEI